MVQIMVRRTEKPSESQLEKTINPWTPLENPWKNEGFKQPPNIWVITLTSKNEGVCFTAWVPMGGFGTGVNF